VKAALVREFLESLLDRHGAKVRARSELVVEADLTPELRELLGPERLVLALSPRGLHEHPDSELATAGNPVFDRLLGLAATPGAGGVRFEAASGDTGASHGKPVYLPIYLFLFHLAYSREELADELECVAIDGVSGTPIASLPDVVDYWGSLAVEPEAGRAAARAFPVRPLVVRAALSTLERRLRKRVGRLQEGSEAHLATELDSIQRYYGQLIEEARQSGKRWSVGPDERAERVRLLQLDWKRRTEQAQELWLPRVDVQLLGVGAAQRPRRRQSPSARTAGARGKASAEIDWPSEGAAIWDEVESTEVRFEPDWSSPRGDATANSARGAATAGRRGRSRRATG